MHKYLLVSRETQGIVGRGNTREGVIRDAASEKSREEEGERLFADFLNDVDNDLLLGKLFLYKKELQ